MYSLNSKIYHREIIEAANFPEISKPISINRMIEHYCYECVGLGSVIHLCTSKTKNEEPSNFRLMLGQG